MLVIGINGQMLSVSGKALTFEVPSVGPAKKIFGIDNKLLIDEINNKAYCYTIPAPQE